MEIAVSLIPVILFLVFLFLLDSFKLVVGKLVVFSLTWGALSALISYLINSQIIDLFFSNTDSLFSSFDNYSRYLAPFIEEILKSLFIIFLLSKRRIGFMIDAAIYGFAIGAGFALVENIYYLRTIPDSNIYIWIIRGFGTAIMHGGCTAILAVMLIGAKSRDKSLFISLVYAFAAAYIIHSSFNHFYINPILQTIGIITLAPAVFYLIFHFNEKYLQQWMEIEFNDEVELLKAMNRGEMLPTRAGEYLASLKIKFSSEMILDMYCYIKLYLELSIKAKRNLLLKESDFPIVAQADTVDKLAELAALRKSIGKVGEMVLSPLIKMNYRDLWKLNLLK